MTNVTLFWRGIQSSKEGLSSYIVVLILIVETHFTRLEMPHHSQAPSLHPGEPGLHNNTTVTDERISNS